MSRTNEDVQEKARAVQDLEDIAALRKLPAFGRYFARRVLGQMETSREKVLHDKKLTPQGLYEERLRYLAFRETVEILAGDEAGCRNIIGVATSED